MSSDVAIKVHKLSKEFLLPHERTLTLKGTTLNLLRFKHHTKDQQRALQNINFEIKKGEFFGIVGRNGSGKSTLLKILAGIYQPSNGAVSVDGKLVPFIELGVGFNGDLTGRENVYLSGALMGFSKKEIASMYDDITDFAELEEFMDQKLKNYSSGMQVRLAFSLATRAKADILLVDEVLAVGDAAFQRKCFEYFKQLKAQKMTVAFVTHDMNAVREYCDRAMLIEDGDVKLIGSPQAVAKQYSLLFMEEVERSLESKKISDDRWGTGAAQITSAKAVVKDADITITAEAKINKKLDKLIYGLHILGQDGVEITAMNNRMIQAPDVMDLGAGSVVKFTWKVQNIFNDGRFFVTLTLVDDLTNTLDWYNKATSFTVAREERSTTAVLPPVTVTSEKIEA